MALTASGSTMATALRPWRTFGAVLAAFVQDGLVYRANAVIWILTDVVTAVTMPLIWLASFNGRHSIHGYDPSQMVLYYLVILGLSSLVQSHIMWEMADDVKQGKFNVYLIRPFPYLAYAYAMNLGWRLMRTMIALPIFALVVLAFHRYLPSTLHVNTGVVFWLAFLLGHLLDFILTFTVGLLSLWLYEARSVFNFYYMPVLIFSGQIAPLALYPSALQACIHYLPFPYTLAFTANIFMERVGGRAILEGFMVQVSWIVIMLALSALLWRGGVRRFTAFGI
ncbi:MAG: ABC transporter permease [Capsulimonadaceae bacterium]